MNTKRTALATAAIIATAGTLGACSSGTATDGSVDYAGAEWECQTVPDDVMTRLLEGEKTNDGQGVTVEKSAMVAGTDNNFVAADLVFPGEDKPFTALFTYDRENIGPITSASKGTASLFNWPETPGQFDGVGAAEKCLGEV